MSLTEAAASIKKGFRYFLLALLGLAGLWIVILIVMALFNSIYPLFASPDLAFGNIPKPSIPAPKTQNLTFSIDTVDGKLPSLPKIMTVYKFTPPTASLLDVDQANTLAAGFGLNTQPVVLGKQTYQYSDPVSSTLTLTIDIVSKNFSINSNFNDPKVPQTPLNDSTDNITKLARQILQTHILLNPDMKSSSAIVSNVKLVGSNIIPADSISNANFTRIDIFRSSVGGYAIVGPVAHQSLINMLLGTSTQQSNNLVQLSYTYWPFDLGQKGTYPVISSDTAYQNLQQGKATLVLPVAGGISNVKIQNIGLAYFEDSTFQPYLEPIILFTGVANSQNGSEVEVRFYLPAIDPANFSD
jgi:hypothetical protein